MVSSEVDRVDCVVNDEVQNTPEIIIIIDLYNVKRTGCDNFIFFFVGSVDNVSITEAIVDNISIR